MSRHLSKQSAGNKMVHLKHHTILTIPFVRNCFIQYNHIQHEVNDTQSHFSQIEAGPKFSFHKRHFQLYIFNKNIWISLEISLKFVLKVQINYIQALVQIIAWRPNQMMTHYLNQWWLVYWHIFSYVHSQLPSRLLFPWSLHPGPIFYLLSWVK